MYQYEGRTFAEDEDLCINCAMATNETKLCPLMKALALNDVAICTGSMIIEECDFYLSNDDAVSNN